jgi:hypothetical protein
MDEDILLVIGLNPSKSLSVRTYWDSNKGASRRNLDDWSMYERDKMTTVDLCGSHLTRLQNDKGTKNKFRSC